jgi:hypothetical protein
MLRRFASSFIVIFLLAGCGGGSVSVPVSSNFPSLTKTLGDTPFILATPISLNIAILTVLAGSGTAGTGGVTAPVVTNGVLGPNGTGEGVWGQVEVRNQRTVIFASGSALRSAWGTSISTESGYVITDILGNSIPTNQRPKDPYAVT